MKASLALRQNLRGSVGRKERPSSTQASVRLPQRTIFNLSLTKHPMHSVGSVGSVGIFARIFT
ncbi:hypothetical protein [Moorena sp. SIO4G3]|uniref:hypothetical protein n=1 Tax=Moorena sp. SIO4G3 TaxID=2607821 RepID=UPI00142C93BF|nr:hypothetical protein [Moorena sp. SIO4G3]NEO81925.1 hypothetical protein [Moorena sp. SIO4G3]